MSERLGAAWLLLAPLAAAAFLCVPALGRPPANGHVPLCAGLTIVTAVSQPDGDYESIKTVESVSDRDVSLRYSSETKESGNIRKVKVQRRVLLKDLQTSTLYQHHFNNHAAITVPGTTAIGTSSAVLRALKTTGAADLGLFDAVASASSVDTQAHPNMFDYQLVEKIRRVGTVPVAIPVIVNDVATTLPAIHASGDYLGDNAEFFFLDDETNPIALRYHIGTDALDVVKISYHCAEPRTRPAPFTAASQLERSLLETGRADVYSIYFSFNSDEIRDESDSTLKEIGDLLARHRDWRLGMGGHTDNVGGDGYNLDLSRRRAVAVKEALVTRFAVSSGRLTTEGHGRNNPKDTNNTLEGRARNRRVELVRLP